MPTQLPTPIEVRNGLYSATATHEQFGATIQPWNEPPIVLYLTACAIVDGKLIPLNGKRSDNGITSPEYATPDPSESFALMSQPEWQAALEKAGQLFDFISSNRDPSLKPSWLA
jgi:hypothetical protein